MQTHPIPKILGSTLDTIIGENYEICNSILIVFGIVNLDRDRQMLVSHSQTIIISELQRTPHNTPKCGL